VGFFHINLNEKQYNIEIVRAVILKLKEKLLLLFSDSKIKQARRILHIL